MGQNRSGDGRGLSRRGVLGLGALGLAVPLLEACGHSGSTRPRRSTSPTGSGPATPSPSGTRPARVTVADWMAARGSRYQIAHRGSGDVYPEHTMVAYQAAYDAGAWAMEVSVDITSDGVLVCLHDATYDRTTTGRGQVDAQPSSVLERIGVRQPQLGPAWLRPPLPPVPRLEQVLTTFGARMVICLEAKDDSAYEPMMALVDKLGIRDSIVVKAYWRSPRVAQARAAGFPVFAYFGTGEVTAANAATLAGRLDSRRDHLGIPATDGDELTYLPADTVRAVVAHGVPVWVYPVHRRADVAYFSALGVAGAVSSSFAYTTGAISPATADDWAAKRVSAGQISRQPDRASIAPTWTGVDELSLAVHGTQQFLALGQVSPIATAAESYRIELDARWTVLPADPTTNITIAFGHEDDAYYEHRIGTRDGYHALVRPDGRLQLYRHARGNKTGTLLAEHDGPALAAGQWATLRVDVTPDTVTLSRTDLATPIVVTAKDRSVRGGYVHIGRSAYDDRAVAGFRALTIS